MLKLKSETAAHLTALATILIWGTTFISTKVLLREFSPIEILFLRFLLGFAALHLVRGKLPFRSWKEERLYAGAGLTGPGRILEEAVHSPYDATGATGGEIIILQNPDGSLLYAVSLGGARVAYADAATGFVVSGDLSSMNQVNAYVWKPSPL